MNLPKTPFIQWLTGWPAGNAGSVGFSSYGLLPIALATVISVGLVTTILYLRAPHSVPTITRVSLWLLRMLGLAALAVLLLQPTVPVQQKLIERGAVAIAVDTSTSMQQTDPRLPRERVRALERAAGIPVVALSRAQIVQTLLTAGRRPPLAVLHSAYRLHVYGFAASPVALTVPDNVRHLSPMLLAGAPGQNRATTDISSAISAAAIDIGGSKGSNLMLISDGGNNRGADPVAAARTAWASGVRVDTAGVGDPTVPRDIAVQEILGDRVVRKDNTVQVSVQVFHSGFHNASLPIAITRDGVLAQTSLVNFSGVDGITSVPFSYAPHRTGPTLISATIPVQPGELNRRNNSASLAETVVDKPLRVLLIDGEPRWEYRYLRNAILRDTSIKLSCLIAAAGTDAVGEGNLPIHGFPADPRTLFNYDVIVVGDVPRAWFTDAQVNALRTFVSGRGGSLIVICGEKHMPGEYAATSLGEVLPVTLPAQAEQLRGNAPWPWQLTQEGVHSAMMRLEDDAAANATIWPTLVGMSWMAGVDRARPGARILAVNPALQNAYGPRILVAVQNFGAGRCLLTTSDSTWKWRWRVGDRYFYRYWGQVLRMMAPHEAVSGNMLVQLGTDKTLYHRGDTVTVTARLLDNWYRPLVVGALQAEISGPGGNHLPLAMHPVAATPGLYTAEVPVRSAGTFTVHMQSPAIASASADTQFRADDVPVESLRPELDEALLRRVAAAGGGRYYRPEEIAAWANSVRIPPTVLVVTRTVELWDTPLALLLVLTPLALEWFVRKRVGMV